MKLTEVDDFPELDDVVEALQAVLDQQPDIRYYSYPLGRDYYQVIYDVYDSE